MLLSEMAKATEHVRIGGDADVRELRYDSRKVQPGDVFCCITGTYSDGHAYAESAFKAGAAALVVERELPIKLPQIIVKNTRAAMAEMAAFMYGEPSKLMTMVGVTGTNGKTSTTYMLKAIAEHAGKKTGLIGTICNLIGQKKVGTEHTTPESVELQLLLKEMVEEGVEMVFMEVSSHALDQGRVHCIDFDVAEFTNLTQDHLDYHGTLQHYMQAKSRLFKKSRRAVVNADDPNWGGVVQKAGIPITRFGLGQKVDVWASGVRLEPTRVHFKLHSPQGEAELCVPAPGEFNVYNALGAAAVALELGFSLEQICQGLAHMSPVPGRLEPVDTGGRGFAVLVDYAHTPDALQNVLKTVRGFAKGRIITVFGCGGDRDPIKRPIMGEIAGKGSDYLVITTDNPRSEEPMGIIRQILPGVERTGCEHAVVEDRREGIRYGLEVAQPGDVVLIAGKGHEDYQEVRGVRSRFDDKEVAAGLLG